MIFYERLRVVSWLVRDTFRQSLAYGIFWILAGVSLVSIVMCASVAVDAPTTLTAEDGTTDFLPRHDRDARDRHRAEISGVSIAEGRLTIAFGAIRLPVARDARAAVHFLQLVLACGVADTLGLLLTIIWTAGFLPGFLDGRNLAVLLAKPASRRLLLGGKFVGVLSFVLLHATVFVGGTWLMLGLRTGVWDAAYLWSVPLLLIHFAIFFSFSLVLAVCTRSTVLCVFGSILFWFLCWGMNFGRHEVVAENYRASEAVFGSEAVTLVEAAYWTLPKPADVGMLLYEAVDAAGDFGQVAAFQQVKEHGDFHPYLSLATSLAFMVLLLAGASRQFSALDY
ncbi:MAG TPA: ABC transporter permease subunit [Pirellulales bacterium]|nr:ABC transporter permease subunit [Pirellulales bacterium]